MNPYFEQTILNADPIDPIRMLYQRAIFCVRDAREDLRHKRIAKRSAAILRAYLAIAKLLAALRPYVAAELSGCLRNLYFHMQQRLPDANMQQADPATCGGARAVDHPRRGVVRSACATGA